MPTQQANCDASCSVSCTGNPPTCPSSSSGGNVDGCERWWDCSPLVLDLNGDGIHTTSIDESPVLFDLSGNGVPDVVGWTNPQTEEGILYFDLNRNGVIDGGAELFGESTALPDGTLAKNGFAALSAYDQPAHGGNGDGLIDPADRVWGRIRVWIDRNHDGVATNDESETLGQQHVVALNLQHAIMTGEAGRDAAGNTHRLQGTFQQRVTASSKPVVLPRALHDVYFRIVRR